MKKDVLEKEAIMGKIYMTACMKGGCAKTFGLFITETWQEGVGG